MPVKSVNGFRYFVVFVDDASRYSHIALLKKKSDAYKSFMDLIYKGGITISTIRADEGSEYLSKLFQSICIENNIRQEFASVATPEEMGIAERLNRTLLEKVRPMLKESNLPVTFWSFTLVQANYLYNRSPHSALNEETPFTKRYGLQENYEKLIPFGCLVNTLKNKNTISKLDDVNSPRIMVGYVEKTSESSVLDFEKAEIIKAPSTSRHNAEIFPGIPDETLSTFMLKNEPVEEDSIDHENYSTVLINLPERGKGFCQEWKNFQITYLKRKPRKMQENGWMQSITNWRL